MILRVRSLWYRVWLAAEQESHARGIAVRFGFVLHVVVTQSGRTNADTWLWFSLFSLL